MTERRDPDRRVRAWLDLMPDEAPDRVIADVLQAVEATPQMRRPLLAASWRFSPMNRLSYAAMTAVAVAVVAGGVLLLSRPTNTVGPSPRPGHTPSAGPSSSAGATLPAELIGGWYGTERPVAGLEPSAGSVLFLDAASVRITQANQQTASLGGAAASIVDGRLRVETTFQTLTFGCATGDVGLYDTTVSPSGRVLSIVTVSDSCQTRPAILQGTWWRKGCLSDGACYGLLDAGTYPTQYVDPRVDPGGRWAPNVGAVTFTVPDGWAQAEDFPELTTLVRADAYQAEASGGPAAAAGNAMTLVTNPFPKVGGGDCTAAPSPDPNLARGVSDLVAFVQHEAWLDVGPVTETTISGHPARWLDLAIRASSAPGCSGDTTPNGEYLTGFGSDTWGLGLEGTARTRLVLVDLGGGDVTAIAISSANGADFDAFVALAMPVVETFAFE